MERELSSRDRDLSRMLLKVPYIADTMELMMPLSIQDNFDKTLVPLLTLQVLRLSSQVPMNSLRMSKRLLNVS